MESIAQILEEFEKKKSIKDPFSEKYVEILLSDFQSQNVSDASLNVFVRTELMSQMQKNLQKEVANMSKQQPKPNKKEKSQTNLENEIIAIYNKKCLQQKELLSSCQFLDFEYPVKRSNHFISTTQNVLNNFNVETEWPEPPTTELFEFDQNALKFDTSKQPLQKFHVQAPMEPHREILIPQRVTKPSISIVHTSPRDSIAPEKEEKRVIKKTTTKRKLVTESNNEKIISQWIPLPPKKKLAKLKFVTDFKDLLILNREKPNMISHSFEKSSLVPDLNLVEFKKTRLQIDLEENEEENQFVQFPSIEEVVPQLAPLSKPSHRDLNSISTTLMDMTRQDNSITLESLVDQVGGDNSHRAFLAMVHYAHHSNVKGTNTVTIASDPNLILHIQ